MSENVQNIAVGDVVQIALSDKHVATGFATTFLVVTEVKSWGVQGYAAMLERGTTPGHAFYRVGFEDVTRIGRAEWMRAEETEPTETAGNR